MPHTRHRHLTPLLQKTLRYSPITGVFGHRQVGKTTLVAQLAGQYSTFDQALALDYANRDPEGFLKGHEMGKTPFVIDECQLAPPLFPALKERIRTHPKPGQFLLTGSVRFSSRKAIKESLTGRMIAWDLLPMDLSELHEHDMPDSLVKIAKAKTIGLDLKSPKYFSHKAYSEYLQKGGLPGVFSVCDLAIREQKFETQLNTMLERDLKLIVQTTLPYATLRLLLATLAKMQGLPLDLTNLSRQSRISVPTTKKLLISLESMFLIRTLKTRGTETKPIVFLEDQGEASFLSEGQSHELHDLLRFCFANFRVQFIYKTELKAEFFQYRNRGGAHVPLAIQINADKNRYHLGVIPILGTTPTPHDLGSAYSFLKKFSFSKILFVTLNEVDRVLSDAMRVIFIGKLV
ncbi:MAG: hypothetical protein A2048_01490 [Deltaproteobacteria bacterium GWA2_45_12]|nr:MAG: hypothetical protein A2048_01490 [Deltaproteobacteria bacterium GWA2_45_12]